MPFILQVTGTSGSLFHCFDIAKSTCLCSVFRQTLIEGSVAPNCKHLLAIQIAKHLSKITYRTVSDEDYVRIVKSVMLSETDGK